MFGHATLCSCVAKALTFCAVSDHAKARDGIKLSLVVATDILVYYWDLLAALYHVREAWAKDGVVGSQGLQMDTNTVLPWITCDEIELAIKGRHRGACSVALAGWVFTGCNLCIRLLLWWR